MAKYTVAVIVTVEAEDEHVAWEEVDSIVGPSLDCAVRDENIVDWELGEPELVEPKS